MSNTNQLPEFRITSEECERWERFAHNCWLSHGDGVVMSVPVEVLIALLDRARQWEKQRQQEAQA